MGTKGKTWVAKKSVRKAFDAMLKMRTETVHEAMKYVHSGVQLVIANEEMNILKRRQSCNSHVQVFVEELWEMDEMLAKLSNHL